MRARNSNSRRWAVTTIPARGSKVLQSGFVPYMFDMMRRAPIVDIR
jgi:hypothetical protein